MSKRREKRKKQQGLHERHKALERRRSKEPKGRSKALSIEEEEKWREEKGVIHCWNCGRTIQAPKWVRAIAEQNSGEKTNSCALECQCGESTNYKF